LGTKSFGLNRFNLMVIGTTLTTSLVCYNSYRPNAYEVNVNGNAVAYVTNKDKAELISKEITSDIKKRFENIKVENNITYQRVVALDSAFSSDELIKRNILNALDIEVNAVEMRADNKRIGILASEAEGAKVIQLVGNHYLTKSSLGNGKIIGAKNKITYIPQKVHIVNVESPEKLVEDIIQNIKSGKTILNIETTGTNEEKVTINFSTVINWTDSLMKGQSQTKSKGQEGSKVVQKQITMINGIKSGEKVIKESILENPKDAVVLKGTKVKSTTTVSTTTAMAVPSRGSITSAFGQRWGRMHEGMDIAGATGDPIYAALDGKVTYAGWESGYGMVIKLSHSGNIQTIYGHCSSLSIKAGESVKKGQVIGKVGNTGNSTGPHLHFEVRVNGKPENPAKYIYNKTET
jgi:murein DD-endopeptidase MepM/ murein hydrolase activator NlpD